MHKVEFCFNSKKKLNALIVSSELRVKADNIEQIFKTHLDRHLNMRIENPKMRKHWSFEWGKKNIYCISAIMARYNLVKNDVYVLDENATFLRLSAKFI